MSSHLHSTAPVLQSLMDSGRLTGRWQLDPRRSTFEFKTRAMWGLAPVKGTFRAVSGTGSVSADGRITGTVAVSANSVDTGNRRRDAHIRSAALLDADEHPQITFRCTEARPSATGVAVTGMVTIRGRTLPVTFDATAAVRPDGEACIDVVLEIDRADYGLVWNPAGMASTKNTVAVHAVFIQS